MIDSRIKLTVLKDTAGVFTDHSDDACDFSRDDFTATLETTDYLYIGFRKAIGGIYVELTTPNTVANSLTVEAYNGSTWTAIDVRDETKGLTRSGYISVDRNSLKETTVNGSTKYWVRLKPSSDHTETAIRGINLVFSDDASLKTHFPDIDREEIIPAGSKSQIIAHQSARDEIIQELRNRGHIKITATGFENIDQWDLLDIYEIRLASTYKALANVFFSLADNPQDKWYTQYLYFAERYQRLIGGLKLSIDTNDNGKADTEEKLEKVRTTRWTY